MTSETIKENRKEEKKSRVISTKDQSGKDLQKTIISVHILLWILFAFLLFLFGVDIWLSIAILALDIGIWILYYTLLHVINFDMKWKKNEIHIDTLKLEYSALMTLFSLYIIVSEFLYRKEDYRSPQYGILATIFVIGIFLMRNLYLVFKNEKIIMEVKNFVLSLGIALDLVLNLGFRFVASWLLAMR